MGQSVAIATFCLVARDRLSLAAVGKPVTQMLGIH